MVTDIHGQPMEAITILAMCIHHLQQHLLRTVTHHKRDVRETDIQYVFTVPSEWNDSANGLMRDAVYQV